MSATGDDLSLDILRALTPRRLNLILFPTEQCNFRCTYCYEDFKAGQMLPEVVQGIKALLAERIPELHALDISWFGGEPLVGKSVIYDISSHILDLTRKHPDVEYRANMTTNAALLDRTTFEELTSLGVRFFQVSLDGDRDLHNKTRVTKNGKGTFDQIWNNLLAIRDCKEPDVTLMLRVHYSPNSWSELLPLIDQINEEFAEDPRFVVYFKSIDRLGGPNDAAIRMFKETAKEGVNAMLNSRLRYPRMVYAIDSDGRYICYASKANSLAIRSNGDIGKCTVALQDSRNRVGKLNSDGTMQIDLDRFLPWLQGLETQEADVLACPYNRMQFDGDADALKEDLDSGQMRRFLTQIPLTPA